MQKNYHNKIIHFLLRHTGKKTTKYMLDFGVYFVGFALATGIGFLMSIFINKSLTPEEMGRFTYYRSVADFMFALLTMNIAGSYLRFNTKGINRSLFEFVKKIKIISIPISILLIYLITDSFIAGLYAFFILYNERLYLFRSTMEMKKVNMVRVITILITFICIIIFQITGVLNSYLVLGAYGIGYIITFFLKSNTVFDETELKIKTILKFSVPLYLTSLLATAQGALSQYILKSYYNYEMLSQFSIAQRVSIVFGVFSTMMNMFYPMIYYREIENKNIRFINRFRSSLSIAFAILAILIIVLENSIYEVMGAREYLPYTSIFTVVIIANYFSIIANFWSNFLGYNLKTHITMIISFVSIVINLSLLLLLVNNMGIIAAAYSMLVANIFYFISMSIISLRYERAFLHKKEEVVYE